MSESSAATTATITTSQMRPGDPEAFIFNAGMKARQYEVVAKPTFSGEASGGIRGNDERPGQHELKHASEGYNSATYH